MTLRDDAPAAFPAPALSTLSRLDDALADLVERLDGTVDVPGSPGWDGARRAWQLGVDQHPVAVVTARSEADVARTMRFAARLDLRVAPQSTGHGAAAVGDLGGAILLRTTELGAIVIDAERRTATVGAGATWGAVAAAAAPHGLAGLAGSSPSVGVVGYALGGGLGWLGRLHGLAAGSILSARVVLPGGAVVLASPTEHADLWWALRGGGGAGVVSELTIRLFDVPSLVAGSLWWPAARAREVLTTWARMLPSLPDEVTTVGRVLRFPDLDELPPHLRAKSFTLVQAAVAGPPELAQRVLAPLRALDPVMDDVAPMRPDALGVLAMDPPAPSAGAAEGVVLDRLDDATIAAWIDAIEAPQAAGVVAADLRHLGGALAPRDGATAALPGLPGIAAAVVVAPVTPVASLAQAQAAVDETLASLAPWAAGQQYANFIERPTSARALLGDAADRLAAVRVSYDPDRTVAGRHTASIAGAAH